MFLSEAIAVIQTILAIGRVIQSVCDEIAPIASDVSALVSIGLKFSNFNNIYVSNKHACTTMVTAIALLQSDVEALNKRHSITPSHLRAHVDAVIALLQRARELLQENIMPDDVARSLPKRTWWIAKRVACTNQVACRFMTMNDELTQMMTGLGVSINVSVSASVDRTFNQGTQLVTDVAELKRYILQQGIRSDDSLHQVLAALSTREDQHELATLVQSHANTNALMRQINVQMDVLQGLSQQQVSQLQGVATRCEQTMRDLGDWSQQMHDAMVRWERQLEDQTAKMIGRIDETDDRRRRAEDDMRRLMMNGFSHESKELRKLMQLIQQLLADKSPQARLPTSKIVVVEFTIDEVQVTFDADSFLGKGGGGEVYWGRLVGHLPEDRDEIAFKKLAVPTVKSSNSSSPSSGGGGRGRGGRGRGAATTTLRSRSTSGDVLSPHSNSMAEEAVRMLRREARISWRLNGGQQCVKLHGICLDPPGLLYEFCNYGTLQDLLYQASWDDKGRRRFESRKLLASEDRISCVAQMLQGLSFLHSKGFVHRDLKSSNCLVHNLGTDDEPVLVYKLSDYGSTRTIIDFVRSSSFSATASGDVRQNGGTLRWLAPERRSVLVEDERKRVEGHPAVDVYALGCVIGEVFLEQPPFVDYGDDDVIRLSADTPPFAPQSLPDPLKPMLSRCCDPKPERRATMDEIMYKLWPRACSALSTAAGRLDQPSVPTPSTPPTSCPALVDLFELRLRQEETSLYGRLFHELDTQKTGELTREQAQPLFATSKLTSDTLACIWTLADRYEKNTLDTVTWRVALRLVALAQQGLSVSEAGLRQHLQVKLPVFEGWQPLTRLSAGSTSTVSSLIISSVPVSSSATLRKENDAVTVNGARSLIASELSPRPMAPFGPSFAAFAGMAGFDDDGWDVPPGVAGAEENRTAPGLKSNRSPTLPMSEARVLVGNCNLDQWAIALSKDTPARRALLDEVITTLSESNSEQEVLITVKAFMAANLVYDLIALLDRLLLHGTKRGPFAADRNLQNLLIVTAVKADKKKVKGYVQSLSNYDEDGVAAIMGKDEFGLYEEAYSIYNTRGRQSEAEQMLDKMAMHGLPLPSSSFPSLSHVYSLPSSSYMGFDSDITCSPLPPPPPRNPSQSNWTVTLPSSASDGLQVTSRLSRRSALVFLDLEISNDTGRGLVWFVLKIRGPNCLGLYPALPLTTGPVSQGATGRFALPLTKNTPDLKAPGLLHIQLKTDVGVFVLRQPAVVDEESLSEFAPLNDGDVNGRVAFSFSPSLSSASSFSPALALPSFSAAKTPFPMLPPEEADFSKSRVCECRRGQHCWKCLHEPQSVSNVRTEQLTPKSCTCRDGQLCWKCIDSNQRPEEASVTPVRGGSAPATSATPLLFRPQPPDLLIPLYIEHEGVVYQHKTLQILIKLLVEGQHTAKVTLTYRNRHSSACTNLRATPQSSDVLKVAVHPEGRLEVAHHGEVEQCFLFTCFRPFEQPVKIPLGFQYEGKPYDLVVSVPITIGRFIVGTPLVSAVFMSVFEQLRHDCPTREFSHRMKPGCQPLETLVVEGLHLAIVPGVPNYMGDFVAAGTFHTAAKNSKGLEVTMPILMTVRLKDGIFKATAISGHLSVIEAVLVAFSLMTGCRD